MANRAYLFPHATPRNDRHLSGLPDRYYDSRHTVPIAWYFFYSPEDLHLIDVESWQEVQLTAPKPIALARFAARERLLAPYVRDPSLREAAAQMAMTLDRWPGSHLVMDPEEIIGGGGFEASDIDQILRLIERENVAGLAGALAKYLEAASTDEMPVRVVGYTYD